jgi:hypothetical protein
MYMPLISKSVQHLSKFDLVLCGRSLSNLVIEYKVEQYWVIWSGTLHEDKMNFCTCQIYATSNQKVLILLG